MVVGVCKLNEASQRLEGGSHVATWGKSNPGRPGAAETKALRQKGVECSRSPLGLKGQVLGNRSDSAGLKDQGKDFSCYFEGAMSGTGLH